MVEEDKTEEEKSYPALWAENETRKHIDTVVFYLSKALGELNRRIPMHDQTKLNDPEGGYFEKYTPKLKNLVYGSEEYKECLEALKPALNHHYAVNKHHPENHPGGVNGMTLIDILEMVCDWRAAMNRHATGNLKDSMDINQKRFELSDQLRKIIENTIEFLDDPKA